MEINGDHVASQQQRVNDLLEQGLQLFGLGQQSEALELWKEVLQLDPQNLRAQEYLRFVSGTGPVASEPSASAAMKTEIKDSPVSPIVSTASATAASADTEADKQTAKLLDKSWGDLLTAPVATTQAKLEPGQTIEAELVDKFSAGALLTSPSTHSLQQESLQRESLQQDLASHDQGFSENPSPQYTATVADDQDSDPWEEGDSITQTVTVNSDEEFLEPLSGQFDIEELSNDPTPYSGMQVGSGEDLSEDAQKDNESAKDASETLMQGAREMFSLGDFTGTLDLVQRILQQDSEHAEAQKMAQQCQDTLLQMYESKINNFSAIPRVMIPPDDVIWLNLHHRAGFLLSQIDGTVSYDDILSLSGMSRFETCKILVGLLEQGVVAG